MCRSPDAEDAQRFAERVRETPAQMPTQGRTSIGAGIDVRHSRQPFERVGEFQGRRARCYSS
jgi:hypothetical protein